MGSSITPTVGSNNTNSGKNGSPVAGDQLTSALSPDFQRKIPTPYQGTVGQVPSGTGMNGTVTLPGDGGQPAMGQPNTSGNTGMTPVGTGLNSFNALSTPGGINGFSGDNKSPMGKGGGAGQSSGKAASANK
jgi:hypothetical protein